MTLDLSGTVWVHTVGRGPDLDPRNPAPGGWEAFMVGWHLPVAPILKGNRFIPSGEMVHVGLGYTHGLAVANAERHIIERGGRVIEVAEAWT